jgi:hypothetical protein
MKMNKRLSLIGWSLIASICLASIPTASLAQSRRPLVEIVPLDPFTLAAGESGCNFAIAIAPMDNKEKLTTFLNSSGNVRLQVITGVRKVQLTNLSTGKIISLNTSGPVQIHQNSDGTTTLSLDGDGVLLFAPGVGSDFPKHAYVRGRTVAVGDAYGNIVNVVRVDGTVQDVCSLLS